MSTTTQELAQLMSDAAAFQEIKLSMYKVGQLDPKTEHTSKDVVRLATDNAVRALNYEHAINTAPLRPSAELVATPDTRRITVEETGNIVLGELCTWLRDNGYLPHVIPTVDQLRDAITKLTANAKKKPFTPQHTDTLRLRNQLRRFRNQHAAVCAALNASGSEVRNFYGVLASINALVAYQKSRHVGHKESITCSMALGQIADVLIAEGYTVTELQKSAPEELAARVIGVIKGKVHNASIVNKGKLDELLRRHGLSTERGTLRAVEDALGDLANHKLSHKSINGQIEGIFNRLLKGGYTAGMGTHLVHISEAVDRMLAKIKELGDLHNKRQVDEASFFNKARNVLSRANYCGALANSDSVLDGLTQLVAANNERRKAGNVIIGIRNELQKAGYLAEPTEASGDFANEVKSTVQALIHAQPHLERAKIKDVLVAAGLADELGKHGVLACVEHLVRHAANLKDSLEKLADEGAENSEQAAENNALRRYLKKHGYGAAGMTVKEAVKVMYKAKHSTEGRFEAEQREALAAFAAAGYCTGGGLVELVEFVLNVMMSRDVTIEALHKQTGASRVTNLASDTAELVRERLVTAGIVGKGCTTDKLLQELDLLLLGMRSTPNIKAFWESGNTLAKKLGLPDWATWSQIFERVDQMTRYNDAGEALADSMRNEPSFFVNVAERMRNAGLFPNGVTATEALAHLDALLEARKSNVTREHAERLNTDRLRQMLGMSVDKTWPEVFDVVRDLLRTETELGNVKRVLTSESIMTESMHTAVVDLLKRVKKAEGALGQNGMHAHFIKVGEMLNDYGFGCAFSIKAQEEGLTHALTVANASGRVVEALGLKLDTSIADVLEFVRRATDGRKALVTLIEKHVGHNISDNFKSINEHVARALEFRTDVMSGGKSVAQENLRTALSLVFSGHGLDSGNLSNAALIERVTDWLEFGLQVKDYLRAAGLHDNPSAVKVIAGYYANASKGVLAAQANNDAALRADLHGLLERFGQAPLLGNNINLLDAVKRALVAAQGKSLVVELRKVFAEHGLTFGLEAHSGTFINAVSRALRFRRDVCEAHGITANVDRTSVKDGIISAVKTLQSAKSYADEAMRSQAGEAHRSGTAHGLYKAAEHVNQVAQVRFSDGKDAEATFGRDLANDLKSMAYLETRNVSGAPSITVNVPNMTPADLEKLKAQHPAVNDDVITRIWFDESSKLPDSPHMQGRAFDFHLPANRGAGIKRNSGE